ncbi:MAG: hypothetical protein Q8Q39_04295 [bacterium]|nr:hypothetical protein [bacterium]
MSPYITTPCVHSHEIRKNYSRGSASAFLMVNIALFVLVGVLVIGYVMIMQNLVSRGYEVRHREEHLMTLRENQDALNRTLAEMKTGEALTAYLASTQLVAADTVNHVKDGGAAVARLDAVHAQ